MRWRRQECASWRTPKIAKLLNTEGGMAAYGLYQLAADLSGDNDLGGLVPEDSLYLLHADDKSVAILQDQQFWEHCPQGWIIHDWDDYNPGAIDPEEYNSEAAKNARSERARNAANMRWGRVRADRARTMPNDAERC